MEAAKCLSFTLQSELSKIMDLEMNVFLLRSNPVSPDPRVEKEASALLKMGHKVTILCWDRSATLGKKAALDMADGKALIYRWHRRAEFGGGVRNIFKLLGFQFFLMVKLFSMRKGVDVIHAADFDTVLPGLLMKFIFKKKLVYDIYDFYVDAFPVPKYLKRLVKWLDYVAITTADVVILTNEARRRQIEGARPQKTYIIHNTPVDPGARPQLSAGKTDFYQLRVVYVGVLQPGRLLEEVVDIFIKNPHWELIVAGFGILESQMLNAASCCDNIKYMGRVSYADGLALSATADVLFATYDPDVPNHRFSSPNKLYEAMMLGKPIIVCKGTGVDELVDQEEIGVSIGYDASEFETTLYRLSQEKTFVIRAEKKARQLYEDHYSWQIMEERLISLYRGLR